ncbi:hypothetical protein B0H11DRAFT_2031995 [Mycena galericulata]|nr:hypothetical protein B0H11DRAFT_2031995 [Mycena galericulata]
MASQVEASAALHACLEGLTSPHQEVANNLEHTASNIQRQLNNLHDPLARLPWEISSEIFIRYLPPPDEYPHISDILLLLNVCTLWTEVALPTTRIWAKLYINIPDDATAEFREVFSRWLLRSRGIPLSLALTGPSVPDPETLDIVVKHAHHLQELELPSPSYLRMFLLGIGFPALTSLDVDTAEAGHRTPSDLKEFVQVLQSAPSLVYCDLGDTPERRSGTPDGTRHVRLKSLIIVDEYGDASDMLDILTLPILEKLTLPVEEVDVRHLNTFLVRSSPPLDTMALHAGSICPWEDSYRPAIEECLHLAPTLTRLELSGAVGLQDMLLTILSQASGDTLLPNLRTLTMDRDGTYELPNAAWYTQLADILSRRRDTLRTFCTELPAYMWRWQLGEPDKDTLRVFRELINAGMDIDMGPVIKTLVEDLDRVSPSGAL